MSQLVISGYFPDFDNLLFIKTLFIILLFIVFGVSLIF
jgi:hypothetical protein